MEDKHIYSTSRWKKIKDYIETNRKNLLNYLKPKPDNKAFPQTTSIKSPVLDSPRSKIPSLSSTSLRSTFLQKGINTKIIPDGKKPNVVSQKLETIQKLKRSLISKRNEQMLLVIVLILMIIFIMTLGISVSFLSFNP